MKVRWWLKRRPGSGQEAMGAKAAEVGLGSISSLPFHACDHFLAILPPHHPATPARHHPATLHLPGVPGRGDHHYVYHLAADHHQKITRGEWEGRLRRGLDPGSIFVWCFACFVLYLVRVWCSGLRRAVCAGARKCQRRASRALFTVCHAARCKLPRNGFTNESEPCVGTMEDETAHRVG